MQAKREEIQSRTVFIQRTVSNCPALPEGVVEAGSLTEFKSCPDEHLNPLCYGPSAERLDYYGRVTTG